MLAKLVVLSWIFLLKEVQSYKSDQLIRSKRVVGGTPSQNGTRPFMVSIRNKKMKEDILKNDPSYMNWEVLKTSTHICGATLISEEWIVSAEHCTMVPNTTEYVLNGWYALFAVTNLGRDDHKYRKVVAIDKIIKHQNYDGDDDIMFMHLKEPIEFNNFIKPICIRTAPLFPNIECMGLGWGTTFSLNKTVISPILKEYRAIYQGPNADKYFKNFHHFKWGNGLGCRGDSGGPMVCRNSPTDVWQLVGVASFASGCQKNDNIYYFNLAQFIGQLDSLQYVFKQKSCLNGSLLNERRINKLMVTKSAISLYFNHIVYIVIVLLYVTLP